MQSCERCDATQSDEEGLSREGERERERERILVFCVCRFINFSRASSSDVRVRACNNGGMNPSSVAGSSRCGGRSLRRGDSTTLGGDNAEAEMEEPDEGGNASSEDGLDYDRSYWPKQESHYTLQGYMGKQLSTC